MTFLLTFLAILSCNLQDFARRERLCDAGHEQSTRMVIARDLNRVLQRSVGRSFPQTATYSRNYHSCVSKTGKQPDFAQEKGAHEPYDNSDSTGTDSSHTRYVDLTSIRDQVRSLRFKGVLLPMFPEVTDGPYGVTITPVTRPR